MAAALSNADIHAIESSGASPPKPIRSLRLTALHRDIRSMLSLYPFFIYFDEEEVHALEKLEAEGKAKEEAMKER